jgi:hypothetical protein
VKVVKALRPRRHLLRCAASARMTSSPVRLGEAPEAPLIVPKAPDARLGVAPAGGPRDNTASLRWREVDLQPSDAYRDLALPFVLPLGFWLCMYSCIAL